MDRSGGADALFADLQHRDGLGAIIGGEREPGTALGVERGKLFVQPALFVDEVVAVAFDLAAAIVVLDLEQALVELVDMLADRIEPRFDLGDAAGRDVRRRRLQQSLLGELRAAYEPCDGAFVPLRLPGSMLVSAAPSWGAALEHWFSDKAGAVPLADIYRAFADHPKARRNQHWRDKLRQMLQRGQFERVDKGLWRRRAS